MNTHQIFCEKHPDFAIIRCRSGDVYDVDRIAYDRGDINAFHPDQYASMNIPHGWSWNAFDDRTAKTLAPGRYMLAIIHDGDYIECIHSACKDADGKMTDDFGYMGVYAHATHYLPIEYITYISDGCWNDVDPRAYDTAQVPKAYQSHHALTDIAARRVITPPYGDHTWFAPIGTETIGRGPAQILGGIYGIIAVILYCIWNILYFFLQLLAAVASSPLAIMELFG